MSNQQIYPVGDMWVYGIKPFGSVDITAVSKARDTCSCSSTIVRKRAATSTNARWKLSTVLVIIIDTLDQ